MLMQSSPGYRAASGSASNFDVESRRAAMTKRGVKCYAVLDDVANRQAQNTACKNHQFLMVQM